MPPLQKEQKIEHHDELNELFALPGKQIKHEVFPDIGQIKEHTPPFKPNPLKVIHFLPKYQYFAGCEILPWRKRRTRQNSNYIFSNHGRKYISYSEESNRQVFPMQAFVKDQDTRALPLEIEDCPVVVTPLISGTWVWLSSQVLEFKPTTRFPKATLFTIVVPKGTESYLGGRLEETLLFNFSTEMLKLVSHFPAPKSQNVSLSKSTTGIVFCRPNTHFKRISCRSQHHHHTWI